MAQSIFIHEGNKQGVFCEYNLCSASLNAVLHVIYFIGLHLNSTWLYIYLAFKMMNKIYAMYNFTLHEMLGFLIHKYSNFVWLPTLTCTSVPVTPYSIINLDHWGQILLKLESEFRICHSKKCNKMLSTKCQPFSPYDIVLNNDSRQSKLGVIMYIESIYIMDMLYVKYMIPKTQCKVILPWNIVLQKKNCVNQPDIVDFQ